MQHEIQNTTIFLLKISSFQNTDKILTNKIQKLCFTSVPLHSYIFIYLYIYASCMYMYIIFFEKQHEEHENPPGRQNSQTEKYYNFSSIHYYTYILSYNIKTALLI